MTKRVIIAVDGPAGVGKTSAARGLARRLGCLFVSSGLVYRAAAWGTARDGVSLDDAVGLVDWLKKHPVVYLNVSGEARVLVGGLDVSDRRLHTPEVSERASKLAALPEIRERLLNCQREVAASRSVVMEGRDVGTVVFPGADAKFFLEAGEDVRAARRTKELREQGHTAGTEEVQAALNSRDALDSNRSVSPLRQAADAEKIDTSGLDLAGVIAKLGERVEAKGLFGRSR